MNAFILRTTEQRIIKENSGEPKQMMNLSEKIETSRQQFLGRIIRVSVDDPMRHVTFKRNTIELNFTNKRKSEDHASGGM